MRPPSKPAAFWNHVAVPQNQRFFSPRTLALTGHRRRPSPRGDGNADASSISAALHGLPGASRAFHWLKQCTCSHTKRSPLTAATARKRRAKAVLKSGETSAHGSDWMRALCDDHETEDDVMLNLCWWIGRIVDGLWIAYRPSILSHPSIFARYPITSCYPSVLHPLLLLPP